LDIVEEKGENLRDSQQDPGARSQGTEQIASNRQGTNASSTEGSSSRNDPLEFLVHALLSVACHDETLILKLLGDISWAGAGNLNPGLGEDGAGDEHVDDVDGGVNRVEEGVGEVQRWGHVVCETRDGEELRRSFLRFPDTEELDEEVLGEAGVEHLADQEDVGRKGSLQHDGHVGGVEEADWVRAACATLSGGLDWDFNTETLEVDNGGEDNEGGQQVHDVGEILSIKSLLERTLLVWPGKEQVEERNDCSLELWTPAGVDGGWGECLPDNGLADVGRNEKGDTASKTISLLEELIEKNNNNTSNNQLEDEEEDNTSAEVRRLTIETSENIDSSLTH